MCIAIGVAAVGWRPLFEVVNSGPVAEDTGRSRGAAWGDFDGDGYPDLFVTRATYDASAPTQPNVLYRNDGGRFVRFEGGPTGTQDGESEGAVWVDLDNDGDLDLHVVGRSGAGSTFYENTGDGRLVRLGEDPFGGAVASASMACWADADGDGRLDVFVVGYRTDRNALFRNTGVWGFERVSLPTEAEGDGSGRACAWGDLDGDALPELVIATARRANVLLRNRGGMTFTVDAGSPLEHDTAYGYGLSWTDVNNDGLRDLFVANFDAGNSLYLGREDGALEPVALGDALQSAASKGHAWGDFDMDGREDLYLGSGTPGPAMYNLLWLATGSGGFDLADDAVLAAHADTSAAIAAADFDGDGALDLFVANWGSLRSPNRLYRNTAAARGWLKVGLEGVRSNRMGIGARVSVLVTIDGERRWLHRWMDASTGYAGQNEPIIHFGLDAAESVDSLVVRWPSGTVDRHGRSSVRRLVRVREGTSPEDAGTA
jgi:hypothetical protein